MIILIFIVVSIIYSHLVINKTRYFVRNKKIDKNLKIVFISDLHNRRVVKKILEIIDIERPDIVIFGGDMVDYDIKSSKSFFEIVDKIKCKKYYVYGNHEDYVENIESYTELVKKKDLVLLNNKSDRVSSNINLIGFRSDKDKYKRFKPVLLNKKDIVNKVNKLDNKKYNILVAHNPLEFDSYVDYGADLVLSGHVHGGVIKIPFIGGLLSPTFTFLPKYYYGIYNKNKTKMIVSAGLGYARAFPIRMFNPGEVVIINLIKDKK